MKVVNVISICAPGGAEILVKNTLLKMKKMNPRIDLGLWVMTKVSDVQNSKLENIEFEKNYVEILEKNGINVKFIGKTKNKKRLKAYFNIRKLYNEFNPDVIHCHLEDTTFHVIIALILKKVTIFQTIHSIKISYPKLQKYFMNFFLKSYISISPEVTEVISKMGIPNYKIKEVFNGIDLDKFKFIKRENKPPSKFIAIGRLQEEKNHELMINSFSEFLKKINSSKPVLKIVGSGSLKEKLEKQVETLNLQKNIIFLGLCEDINQVLSENEVYLMSSLYEGLSISLIEASANGLPIIATNVGSNSTIVKNGLNGYLVKNNNQDDFCKKLIKMYETPMKIEKFSEHSREIAEKFSLENAINDLVKLYKN